MVDHGRGGCRLATACRETADFDTDAHTSVNVAARQLQHPTLLASVKDALQSSGLAPERLIL
jgi:EAL domain-containing protein (putative c-di-GMP-specific phosphodiesterase class I)